MVNQRKHESSKDSSKDNSQQAQTAKRKSTLDIMPSDPTGRRFVENFKYFRQYDHINKKNTQDPKESWLSCKEYPLSYQEIWRRHQDPNKIIGLRPGQESDLILTDIDFGSIYHPDDHEDDYKRFLKAMAEIGLEGYIQLQSSYREGIHVIFPLKKPFNSYKIGKAITHYLLNKGFVVQPGTLEIFPNKKSYDEEKIVLYQGIRLPLQPNSGSYLLDEDFTPYSNDIDEFNALIDEQRKNQDLRRFKRFIDNPPKLNDYSLLIKSKDDGEYSEPTGYSEKAREWKESLEFLIAEGFTGRSQTDEFTRRTISYAIVFLGLQGEKLIEWCIDTIRNAPNFYKYSRHQHDIHKKVRSLCRRTEKSGYYLKYRAFPKRDRKYYEIYREGVDRWRARANDRKDSSLKLDALDRIRQVVAHIKENAIAIPEKLTELSKLINSISKQLFEKGFSATTLYGREIKKIWQSLINEKSSVSADEKDENTENAETLTENRFLLVTDENISETENFLSSESQSGSGFLSVALHDVCLTLGCPEGRPTLQSGGLSHSNQEIVEDNATSIDEDAALDLILEQYAIRADEEISPEIRTFKMDDFEIDVDLGDVRGLSEYEIQEIIIRKLTFQMGKSLRDPERRATIRQILDAEKAKLAALSPSEFPNTDKETSEPEPELITPEKRQSSQQPELEQQGGDNVTPTPTTAANDGDDPPPSPVLQKKGIKLLDRKIFKALDALGIERNRTINELIAKYPESQVWKAIGVLKVNLDKAYSPVGLFIKALRDGWHLDNRNDLALENPVKVFPPGFEEAYARGVKLGYFEDVPVDNLSFFNYEPQVWVINAADKKGFSSMSWSEAIDFIGFG